MISCVTYLQYVLNVHGWDTKTSTNNPSKPIKPLLESISHKMETALGPEEHTVGHWELEQQMGFLY
jgi:hypothetical protein